MVLLLFESLPLRNSLVFGYSNGTVSKKGTLSAKFSILNNFGKFEAGKTLKKSLIEYLIKSLFRLKTLKFRTAKCAKDGTLTTVVNSEYEQSYN